MTPRLHEKIRQILENTPGLTQRGLAEYMGLNPAAVNRMLYGRRGIRAEEVPLIEAYLGRKVDMPAPVVAAAPAGFSRRARGFADGAQQSGFAAADATPVPVYAGLDRRDIVDWAPRHPLQMGIQDAFALYVQGDAMAPRYFAGELVYLHPGRPVESGRDVALCRVAGQTEIARVVLAQGEQLHLQQFNPPAEDVVMRGDILHIHAIVGRA